MTDRRIAAGKRRVLQATRIRRDGFTLAKRKRFLDALAATCNVRLAARAAGVTVPTCYRLRGLDATFADAWQTALAIGYDRLEAALLDYAIAKVEADDIDPDAVDPKDLEGSVVKALAERAVSGADLQFAMALLNRHQATVEGRRTIARGVRGKGRATAEETDAALRRKLDALARRVAGK